VAETWGQFRNSDKGECLPLPGNTDEDTEDLMHAIANCRMYIRELLLLLVVTNCKCYVHPLTNQNRVYSHSYLTHVNMKGGSIAPHTLDHGTRWRWVVSFKPWCFLSKEREPGTQRTDKSQ
jgi:hypothetical protein